MFSWAICQIELINKTVFRGEMSIACNFLQATLYTLFLINWGEKKLLLQIQLLHLILIIKLLLLLLA